MSKPGPLEFRIAAGDAEFEQIHRLNYRTFVEEIPQHQPQSELSLWFQRRLGPTPDCRRKKILIAALARKLLIALWRFDAHGVVPEGAVFKTA